MFSKPSNTLTREQEAIQRIKQMIQSGVACIIIDRNNTGTSGLDVFHIRGRNVRALSATRIVGVCGRLSENT
jgi:hypothetical protein